MTQVVEDRRNRQPSEYGRVLGVRWWRHPWLRLLRPLQWSKNGVVLAALVFGGKAGEPQEILAAVVAAMCFCAVSSATYIVNDWSDIARDRLHPIKQTRPLASGDIEPDRALRLAGLLAIGGLGVSAFVSPVLALVLLGFLALQYAYSFWLKRLVIIDVFAIAAGFLLRAVAGGVAVGVPVSSWLMMCTGLLALFLGFCKRRNELMTLNHVAGAHRASLGTYTVELLDHFIFLSAASTIMAYSMYTFSAPSVPDNNAMMFTIPIMAFALFRYLFLVYAKDRGGAPELLLFRDAPLLGAILLWAVSVVGIFVWM